MAGDYVPQSSESIEANGESAGFNVNGVRDSMRLLMWPSLFALIIGLVSLLSFSLNASELMRPTSPSFGAWWEANQFYFMEGGATALGLLLGIGVGNGTMADRHQRSRARLAALVLAIIAFTPLIHLCAVAARMGWSGRATSLASRITAREGYEMGRYVDRVLITAVYFFKTVAFAMLCGLGLMAIACAAVIVLHSTNAEIS
jgi:hypothetical protein